jgi:hypothetical protein
VSRTWSPGTLCLIAIWLGASHQLHAQPVFTRLDHPDEVFREPVASDAVITEHLQYPALEEPLLERLPAPEDEFAVGVASSGQIPRRRPMSGGPPGNERAPFKSRLFWMPSQSVQGQPGNLAINGEEFDLSFPLRIDENGIWLALGGVQRLDINGSAVLPDSGLPVPSQLWDIEAGLMHIRDLGDGRQAGGMLRIGSPSDQPFAAWRDMTVTFLGFLTIPAREKDSWSFSLFYSPTGQIIFPIPGIAYVWRPNDRLQANLGVPFSLEYKPTETAVFTASYMPLNNVQVMLRQSLGKSWSLYGGYRTVSETFLLANRENNRERTYLFDQRVTAGCSTRTGTRLEPGFLDRLRFRSPVFPGRTILRKPSGRTVDRSRDCDNAAVNVDPLAAHGHHRFHWSRYVRGWSLGRSASGNRDNGQPEKYSLHVVESWTNTTTDRSYRAGRGVMGCYFPVTSFRTWRSNRSCGNSNANSHARLTALPNSIRVVLNSGASG